MAEIALLESDAALALGKRVLCDNVLERWEAELSYIHMYGKNLSITQLYDDAVEHMSA